MTVLEQIITAIEQGKRKQLKMLIEEAVEEGTPPKEILDKGFLPAMENVSRKYHNEQFFVPEVILASQAMNVGTAILEDYMGEKQLAAVGRVVIGTVKGDLHNIGKNIVVMMLRGAGFEVIDLGYDVSVDAFIETAQACEADIICMSAMLTTTMVEMKKVIGKLVNKGLRRQYIIMVGGAPVTEAFARSIGADIYTEDAGSAAQMAKEAMRRKGKL